MLASKGCGTTVMFADVPFTVAVDTQDASVLPHPQLPGVALSASVGQASPAVETYQFGLVHAFTVLVASPKPSLSPSAYQVTVEPIVI